MEMNLILFGMSYPVLGIMYAVMRGLSRPKSNVVIGVTLPWTRLEEEAVKRASENYQKELKRWCLILAASGIPCLFVKSFSVVYMLFVIWILAIIIALNLVYIRWNKELMRWKKEQLWAGKKEAADEGAADVEAPGGADTSVLHAKPLFAAVAVGLLPLLYECIRYEKKVSPPRILAVFILWTVLPLLLFAARCIDKGRCAAISSDRQLNAAYEKERKAYWARAFSVMVWTSLFYLFYMEMALRLELSAGFLAVTVCYCMFLCGQILWLSGRFHKLNERYGRLSKDRDIRTDEDEKWIWGMFYYNQEDKRFLVEERAGIGTTVNLARKAGKVFAVFTVLCLLLLPLSSVWLFMEEYMPLQLSVQKQQVVAFQWKTDYKIPLSDIESVKLEALPKVQSRLNGSSVADLRKGTFRVETYGVCELFLRKETGPYLVVTGKDGTVWILGGRSAQETKKVYEKVKKELPAKYAAAFWRRKGEGLCL